MGRPPSFEECLAAGRRPRRRVRARPDGQADRRRRARPRGDRPQRLDPRRRGRDLRPPADRHRAAPARRRRHGRGRPEGLPHGHAVLDEAGRGDRPPQDGLPRPAQPRRDRGHAGHHRALDRRAARHDDAPARRREDLRDDGPGRLGGRVPVRVRGHARGAARRSARPSSRTSSRSTRCTARARWTRSRPTRAASATPTRSRTSTSGCARSPEPTKGVILYQEQAMQIAKSIAGFSGPRADDLRKAIGKKNREAMAKLKPMFFDGCRASGTRAGRHRVAVDGQREVGRLLVQPLARRLLRADRLPHRVAEGQLPGRVHGGADLAR